MQSILPSITNYIQYFLLIVVRPSAVYYSVIDKWIQAPTSGTRVRVQVDRPAEVGNKTKIIYKIQNM